MSLTIISRRRRESRPCRCVRMRIEPLRYSLTKRWRGWFLAMPLALLGHGAPAFAASLPALQDLRVQRGVAVSALVVRLDSGRTVASIEPRKRLIPASLTKLYTAAAALEHWGPQFRFTTRLAYSGRMTGDGLLKGNLVFVGSGDPGLLRDQLWELAANARQAGLRRVDGDLIVDQSLFGDVECRTHDRCRALDASGHSYDAPLSAAGVDYGAWCLAVRAASVPGRPAQVSLCPPAPVATGIMGSVKTVPAGDGSHVALWRTSQNGVETLHVDGAIASGLPTRRYYVSAGDPAQLTGQLLHTLLRRLGIEITGKLRVVSVPVPALTPLAAVKGPVLANSVSLMLHYSNNYMADTLALDLTDRKRPADDPLTLAEAGSALGRYAERVDRRVRLRFGSPSGEPTLESGSGLTPGNRLSAADLVALLGHVYRETAIFPAYLAGLSVPRSAPLRMLKGGDGTWMSRVAVKTGSMDDPVSVLGVAGYYRSRDGGWGAFAVIVNGTPRARHFPWYEAMAAIERDMSRLIRGR